MPDKKLTELPENTSANNNDKIYIASAGGVSKFIRLSTLVDFIISLLPPSTGGDSVRVFLGRIAPSDIPTTGTLGEYFINSDTKTYWQWNPDNEEFEDTGDPVQDVEADTAPTLGSVNYVLSDGIYQALINKANLNHAHSTSEAWLSDIINLLVSKSGFVAQFLEKAVQGTGIVISETLDGKIRIARSGGDGESGDWGSIGGDIDDQTDLKLTYQKLPGGWTEVTPIEGVLTLTRNPDKGQDQRFRFSGSGAITLALSGDYVEGDLVWLEGTMEGDSLTITLPSGWGAPLEYTDKSIGDIIEPYFVNKGSYWQVYDDKEDEEEGTTDYEVLSNKPSINGVELTGDVNSADLGISYNDLEDLPTDDEYIEFANLAAFPVTGASDVLYAAIDTGFLYRWTGSTYTNVGGVTVPDATETTKGKVELGDQTESEAAATATASSGADHTKAATLRGLFWFWAKIKSLWAFTSLNYSGSISWDWGSKIFSNKTLTATGNPTVTLSNVVDGGEGKLIVTLSGVTSVTITLAGSGLTFKKLYGGATITSLTYSGASGDVVIFPCIVVGTTVYFVTEAYTLTGTVVSDATKVYTSSLSKSEDELRAKLGGESKGSAQSVGTNDNFDFILKRNGVELMKLLSTGATLDDHFKLTTVGKGFFVKEGTNAYMGVATLVAGSITVSNSRVTTSSRIQLSIQSLGTVASPKAIAVTARTAGVSFTITSSDTTDTSVIAWQIFEPS